MLIILKLIAELFALGTFVAAIGLACVALGG